MQQVPSRRHPPLAIPRGPPLDPDTRAAGGGLTAARGRPGRRGTARDGAIRRPAARVLDPPADVDRRGAAQADLEADRLRARPAGRLPLEPGARDPRPLHGGPGQARRRRPPRLPRPVRVARPAARRGAPRSRRGHRRGALPGAAGEPGKEAAGRLHLARRRLPHPRGRAAPGVAAQDPRAAAHRHRHHQVRPAGGGGRRRRAAGGQEALPESQPALRARRDPAQPAPVPGRRRAALGLAHRRAGARRRAAVRGDHPPGLRARHARHGDLRRPARGPARLAGNARRAPPRPRRQCPRPAPAARAPAKPHLAPRATPPGAPELAAAPSPDTASAQGAASPAGAASRNEIMQAYLSYRRLDAFDLLGADEDASPAAVEGKYLEFARRFAPWTLAHPEPGGMEEKARDLFLAGARAYAELLDLEQRNTVLFRRQARREERDRRAPADLLAIKTDLLDPEVQYHKGRAFMDAGKFQEAALLIELASDCDPQNGLYSAELAYCRFRLAPGQGARALKELQETLRRDPDCGLAVFYTGEVHRQMGDREDAETMLRRAIKMMAPDRRPIEALKLLSAERRR